MIINNISFYINNEGKIEKCTCTINNHVQNQTTIYLPMQRLQKILYYLINNYQKNTTIRHNNKFKITSITNIKSEDLYSILKESKQYKEIITAKHIKEEERKKVVRKNKVKKAVIITTSVVTAIIIAFTSITKPDDKKTTNDNDNNKITSTLSLETDLPSEKDIPYKTDDNIIDNKYENISDTNITNDDSSSNAIDLNNTDPTSYTDEITTETISINAENWTENEKYLNAKSCYFDSISKIAKTYGIDPNLALALCTHERGIHSSVTDPGGAVGLFQIQVEGKWSWVGKEITAFNFDTNSYETITVTKEKASNLDENIKIGCMIIQDLLVRNNYNVLKAVTEYNYGIKNLQAVLERCSNETGFSQEELNNMENTEWLKYRNIISGGDPEYIENVFKYISDGTILSFNKINGENITVKYNNISKHNVYI